MELLLSLGQWVHWRAKKHIFCFLRDQSSDKLIIHCISWVDSQFLQLKCRVLNIKTRVTVNLLLSCTVNNQWIVIYSTTQK